jgi:hypothetical protein
VQLYQFPGHLSTRWFSAENPKGLPGQGARRNRGAKGSPSVWIEPGAKHVLLDTPGPGVIRRIWLTCSGHQDPQVLRGVRLRFYWEKDAKPAVDCPLGDFFGLGLGRKAAFESVFFADPEGRSFNCFIPMPFRRHARAELFNETGQTVQVFYEINTTEGDALDPSSLYFHAQWRRSSPNVLGRDHSLLPAIKGRGRYLGANLGVIEDKRYRGTWFGEGELKLYLDGDKRHPSLCGTGTEDMIATAWGQGRFSQLRTGCPVRDDNKRQWCFYRYHSDDPVYFQRSLHVAIQVMGGAYWRDVQAMQQSGAPLKVIAVMGKKRGQHLALEKGMPKKIAPDQWCNFWRQDDISSTAYFYLDRTSAGLPGLATLKARL